MAKANLSALAHKVEAEPSDANEPESEEDAEGMTGEPQHEAMKNFHEAHEDGDHEGMHKALESWMTMHQAKEHAASSGKPSLHSLMKKGS
jgi:hypothetical protein